MEDVEQKVFRATTLQLGQEHHQVDVYSSRRSKPKQEVSPYGCRSLSDLAIVTTLRNLDRLNADSLVGFPPPLVDRIWQEIDRRDLDSLTIWKLFVSTGSMERPTKKWWYLTEDFPLNFPVVFKHASSPSFDWLTDLTLESSSITTEDLLQLSRLNNVRNLIVQPASGAASALDDRILRSWAFDATHHGAFSKLEGMYIDEHPRVTDWSLQYLNDFPSLHTFCLHRCGVRNVRGPGKKVGWINRVDKDITTCFCQVPNARLLYANQKYWGHLIGRYITRRNSAPDGSHKQQNPPLLNINVNIYEANNPDKLRLNDIVVFERDWNFEQPTSDNKKNEAISISKRRKVKDSKAMSLGDIFNTL